MGKTVKYIGQSNLPEILDKIKQSVLKVTSVYFQGVTSTCISTIHLTGLFNSNIYDHTK